MYDEIEESGSDKTVHSAKKNVSHELDSDETNLKVKKTKSTQWSIKQTNHRKRFSQMNLITKANRRWIINSIWKYSPELKHSAYALFFKFVGPAIGNDCKIRDYCLLKVSKGILPSLINLNIAKGEIENEYVLSWEIEDSCYAERLEDSLAFATLKHDTIFFPIYTDIKRGEKRAVINLDYSSSFADYIYVFLVRKDNKAFSDSCAIKWR